MKYPADLLYTKDHEWIRIEDDGAAATVGVTDFAQDELGDVVFAELQPPGSEIARDEPFGAVEAVKTVSDVYMPLSGRILEVNEDLEAHPDYVNTDPYGKGWMIRIALADGAETGELLSAEDYERMTG